MRLRIPAGAQPDNNWDGHMTVVDQSRGLEYDFWRAAGPSAGTLTVSSGNSIPIGPNSGTGIGGVAEAANLGLLGGLIRAPELNAGRIDHAIAVTMPCVQRTDVWPSPSWGTGDAVCPQYGAGPHFANLLQLNMSDQAIARSRAPRWQKAIMTAMAHYGMYVVDTSGLSNQMSLVEQADPLMASFRRAGPLARFVRSLGGSTIAAGAPIDIARLRVIAPCVPERTC
jgi:hypothetical protein